MYVHYNIYFIKFKDKLQLIVGINHCWVDNFFGILEMKIQLLIFCHPSVKCCLASIMNLNNEYDFYILYFHIDFDSSGEMEDYLATVSEQTWATMVLSP